MDLVTIGNPIRPPAEAGSIILQATIGCPHATCTFCGAYQGIRFRVRTPDEFRAHAHHIADQESAGGSRVFLGDGDTLALPASTLLHLFEITREVFPEARRFGIYGGSQGILSKSTSELEGLKKAGINTVYLGLESGSEDILIRRKKSATAEQMIEAVRNIQAVGMRASVMVLLGLGGVEDSNVHALETAKALNAMQPRLLSVLTLMLVPGTPLWKESREGLFRLPSAREMLVELRLMIGHLELQRTVFNANHASSFLPLEGALPRDKAGMLALLDDGIHGRVSLVPDFFRGL